MDGLNAFLQTDTGRIFSGICLLLCVADFFIAHTIFRRLQLKIEASIRPDMAPAEKAPLQQRAKSLQTARNLVYVGATLLGLFGIYGLSL